MSQEPQKQWSRDEKDEKGRDEKRNEKGRDEKRNEKGRDEKGRTDSLSTLAWAAIFVWAGLALLAENLDLLGEIKLGDQILNSWSLIFIGAGIIILVEVAIRLFYPAYRRPVTGSIIFAGILLAIGLGGWVGWNYVWPLIIILVGVSILVGSLTRR